jgi:hypothetical protein
VKANDPECKSLLLQHGSQRSLLLVTWNGQPATVAVAFGFPVTSAVDVETKQALPVTAAELSVPLDGYGLSLLRLQ